MTNPQNPLDVRKLARECVRSISEQVKFSWGPGQHVMTPDRVVESAIRCTLDEALAAQAAEIERLRAERDTARDLLDSNVSSLGKSLAEAGRNVEKLRNALERMVSDVERYGACDAITGRRVLDETEPQTPAPIETGAETEAELTRAGYHLNVRWVKKGVQHAIRVYEPQGLPLSAALADVLAFAAEEGIAIGARRTLELARAMKAAAVPAQASEIERLRKDNATLDAVNDQLRAQLGLGEAQNEQEERNNASLRADNAKLRSALKKLKEHSIWVNGEATRALAETEPE